ncbi:MAG: hypothetical protein AAF231_03120 [Pseudomonadota bacterium]
MPHEYSAENHDWDLTLRAAFELLQVGKVMDQRPRTGNMSMGFSAFTGSMLLSFSSIESFSASVAFSMPRTGEFKNFDFEAYRRERTFWGKLGLLFAATGQNIDRSKGLFQTIAEMRHWRNLVTHASPYRIENVEIENTTTAVGRIHKPKHIKEYTRSVDLKTASKFYQAAFNYIEYLEAGSGLEPRAQAVFKIGG